MLTLQTLARIAAGCRLEQPSIVVRRLDDPRAAAVNLDGSRYLYPASMLKTPLAMAVFARVHDGALSLEDRVEVTEGNMTANDRPSPLVPGYAARIDELIALMITRSDNVATNMFYDILGRHAATDLLRERFGLRETAFYRKLSGSLPLIEDPDWDGTQRNVHSAADAARVFEMIARTGVPFAPRLREILAAQEWNDKLSPGLHAGDRFAHKTGDTDEVTHDGGILELTSGASYVVVVYTGMESNAANNAKFTPFMAELRAAL